MIHSETLRRLVFLVPILAGGGFASASAVQNDTLNPPLAGIPSDVTGFWTIAGNGDVFYQADQEFDGVLHYRVYRAAADGSGSTTLVADVQQTPIVAPDGGHVVYQTSQFAGDFTFSRLYSWSSGAAAPVELDDTAQPTPAPPYIVRVSPDGQQVLFLRPNETTLFSSAIDGTELRTLDTLVQSDFGIGPDSQHAVYRARNASSQLELRSCPIDGTSSPVTLSGPLVTGGNVESIASSQAAFELAVDGSRVVYVADQLVNAKYELFSVPVDASSAAVRVSSPMVPLADLLEFEISPDGDRVVYLADARMNERHELFVASIEGGATARRLNPKLVTGGDVHGGFRISGDGRRVVYFADQSIDEVVELFTASLVKIPALAAEPPPRRLSAALVTGGEIVSFLISPDGGRIAYLADGVQDQRFELFGVPIDASALAVLLSGALVANGDVANSYVFSPDGARVAYLADQLANDTFEVFGAPSDGSAAPVRLSDPPIAGGDVGALRTSTDGTRALYLADKDIDDEFELYSLPVLGNGPAVRVNDELDRSAISGDVHYFGIAADDAHLLYRADGDLDEVNELYSVDVASPGQAVKLNIPLSGTRDVFTSYPIISGDGARALYVANQDSPSVRELYVVPVDGSAGPSKVNSTLASGHVQFGVFAPLGRVLYVAAQDQIGVDELYSVPADGSLAPVKLNGVVLAGHDVLDLRVPVAGSRVVFATGTNGTIRRFALHSVPVDGSGAAVQLTPPLVAGGVIWGYEVDSTGTRVIYAAEQEVDERTELYSVPIDGSAAAVKLNGTLAPGGAVVPSDFFTDWFRVSADGARVFYVADQDTNDVFELYSVPSNGVLPPVKLNAMLVAGGDVLSYVPSPDGSRLAYRATQDQVGKRELYSVPSNGSALPVKLNGPLAGTGVQGSFNTEWFSVAFSSDGSAVVYRADQDTANVFELYSVPSAGGSAPVKVSAPSASSMDGFWMRPGASEVIYHRSSPSQALLLAPLDASSAPVQVSGPMTTGGTIYVGDVVVASGGGFVVYRADQNMDEVYEVFRTVLP